VPLQVTWNGLNSISSVDSVTAFKRVLGRLGY